MTRTRRRPTAAGHTLKRNENPGSHDEYEKNIGQERQAILESTLSNIPEEDEEGQHEESLPGPRTHRTDRLPKHPENAYRSPTTVSGASSNASSSTSGGVQPTVTLGNTIDITNPGDNNMHLEKEQRYLTTDRHRKMAIAKHAHDPDNK